MSDLDLHATLLALLEGDDELFGLLRESGFLPLRDEALCAEHLELARVAHTLLHELDVNWPGVEIVLRLRSELLATRRQTHQLVQLVERLSTPRG